MTTPPPNRPKELPQPPVNPGDYPLDAVITDVNFNPLRIAERLREMPFRSNQLYIFQFTGTPTNPVWRLGITYYLVPPEALWPALETDWKQTYDPGSGQDPLDDHTVLLLKQIKPAVQFQDMIRGGIPVDGMSVRLMHWRRDADESGFGANPGYAAGDRVTELARWDQIRDSSLAQNSIKMVHDFEPYFMLTRYDRLGLMIDLWQPKLAWENVPNGPAFIYQWGRVLLGMSYQGMYVDRTYNAGTPVGYQYQGGA